METMEKASKSAHEAVDKVADATNQSVEALGEKGEQLKRAEQQFMKYCFGYVRYNPWVSQ